VESWYVLVMGEKPKFSCRRDIESAVDPITSTEFARSISEEMCLFSPTEEPEKLDRTKIPEELETGIQAFGEVVDSPSKDEYDPKKPNLYLIGVGHVVDQEDKTEYQKIQKNAVQVFHQIYKLGVKQQFIEGIVEGEELCHDKPDPILEEHPIDAMPKYKKTGKIKRAYIAVEGIYGDKVDSIGADDPTFLQLNEEHERAARILRPKAMSEIFHVLAKELGVNVDQSKMADLTYTRDVLEKLRDKVSKLSAEEKKRLIDKHVLKNETYKEYLEIAKRFWYGRIQGRNLAFAKAIKAEGGEDSAMVVGSHHLGHLKKQFPDFNVFVIAPKGLEKKDLEYEKSSFEKEEEYEEDIMSYDLALFGLN
jgi:hypothetical protein